MSACLSESAQLRVYHATCAQGCRRSDTIAVAMDVPDGSAVAGKAFLVTGWHNLDGKWYCAACWQRIVSARGTSDEVLRTIRARGYALAIDIGRRP